MDIQRGVEIYEDDKAVGQVAQRGAGSWGVFKTRVNKALSKLI